jgi:hypothetical protein
MDGRGEPVSKELQEGIASWLEENLPWKIYLYPLLNGGVEAEIDFASRSVTIEVMPDGLAAQVHGMSLSDNEEGVSYEVGQKVINLNSVEDVSELFEALMKWSREP